MFVSRCLFQTCLILEECCIRTTAAIQLACTNSTSLPCASLHLHIPPPPTPRSQCNAFTAAATAATTDAAAALHDAARTSPPLQQRLSNPRRTLLETRAAVAGVAWLALTTSALALALPSPRRSLQSWTSPCDLPAESRAPAISRRNSECAPVRL